MAMTDQTSGFNITTDLSFSKRFTNLAGLTTADVRQALEVVTENQPAAVEHHLSVMTRLFNGYCFDRRTPSLFNTSTALSYLQVSSPCVIVYIRSHTWMGRRN